MPTVAERLDHIRSSIATLRAMLRDKSFEDAQSDIVIMLASERCVEIISEASRHIPDDLKERLRSGIPWRSIANSGNVLRHAYHRRGMEAIWAIYTKDLDPLQAAIDVMIAELPTPPAPSPS